MISIYLFTQVLEMDVCDLEMDSMKAVLLNQPLLHTFRCPAWLHTSPLNLANLQLTFRLSSHKPFFSFIESYSFIQALQSSAK